MCTNYYRVANYFKFAPATEILPGKLTFYSRVLKSIACVAIVRNAADEIKITIFFQILRNKENK
jgi:hypothetical protein